MPQFRNRAEYSDVFIQAAIDESVIDMGDDESRWGIAYDYAQRNLVAHKLVIATRQELGDPSPVRRFSSASAGGVSVNYEQQQGGGYADPLLSTSYGAKYHELRTTYFGTIVI